MNRIFDQLTKLKKLKRKDKKPNPILLKTSLQTKGKERNIYAKNTKKRKNYDKQTNGTSLKLYDYYEKKTKHNYNIINPLFPGLL